MKPFEKEFKRWAEFKNMPAEYAAELRALANDPRGAEERFGAHLEFGTAGIRGVMGAGINRMNSFTVTRAAYGVARYIEEIGAKARGAVISYDTRNNSEAFAKAAAGALAARGVRAILFDAPRPVPLLSFAVRHTGAAAGIMITASHNSKEYNGFKVYGEDGAQMSLDGTAAVAAHINALGDILSVPRADDSPLVERAGAALDEAYYGKILKTSFGVKKSGRAKIVYTPLHGSGLIPVTALLKAGGFNFRTVEEQCAPDGNFPTVKLPNPENPEALSMGIKLAEASGADIVLGTDPDCDRMGAAVRGADGKFILLTGNQTGALMLDYIVTRRKEAGTLPANSVFIKTIVTTSFGEAIARAAGVKCEEVLTGFKFIGEKIRQYEREGGREFLFGYEESYGYLSHTFARDKDAAAACMLFAEMADYYADNGGIYGRLQYLYSRHGRFIEKNISREYVGADGMSKMRAAMENVARAVRGGGAGGLKVLATRDYRKGIRSAGGRETPLSLPKTDAVYYELENGAWLCVRPSGTEPKLKIYLGARGRNAAEAEKDMAALVKFAAGV